MRERISIIGGHILVDRDGPFVLVSGDEARKAKLEQLDSRIKADLARHAASLENDTSKPNS